MAAKDEQRESAELAAATAARWREHPRAESHAGIDADGQSDKPIEIHAVGDRVLLNTHGERQLDRDAVLTLQKELQKAFQVVA